MLSWLEFISYLPEISSLQGIIFYSFITYVFIFTTSYTMTKLINDNFDYESNVKKRIIKNRIQKTKEADRLVKKF